MISALCGFFSLLAFARASIGLYGVMAYTTARRTSEIRIRLALGAERGDVLWMVLKESLVLVIAGVCIGGPATLASTSLLSGWLFGVAPNDSLTLAVALRNE